MIFNLMFINVECYKVKIAQYITRLYSDQDFFELKMSAFLKCIKGGMCL
jgi:hypothetical protein